jgi:ribosomal protein S27AE
MPTRLLFENAGGKVIFSHKAHAEGYKVPCQQCHHESKTPSKNPISCTACHPASFEEGFVAEHQKTFSKEQCGRCHHTELSALKFDHEAHKGLASGCTDCHHDSSIEEKPTNCAECHQAAGDESMPSLRDANHKRCATCHEDMFSAKIKGCGNCHGMAPGGTKYPACGTCHFDTKKLPIPATMEAFHTGCMKCHKEKGAGPYTPQDCNKCHYR